MKLNPIHRKEVCIHLIPIHKQIGQARPELIPRKEVSQDSTISQDKRSSETQPIHRKEVN